MRPRLIFHVTHFELCFFQSISCSCEQSEPFLHNTILIFLKYGPPLYLHLIRFEVLSTEQQIQNMADPLVERRGHL